jgi:extradiol dioxygenase family protein
MSDAGGPAGGIPFHLAFPVTDLASTRAFYGGLLGCTEGRSAERWVDFDFFGHQISAHLVDAERLGPDVPTNPVDGDAVPARRFLPDRAARALPGRDRRAGDLLPA